MLNGPPARRGTLLGGAEGIVIAAEAVMRVLERGRYVHVGEDSEAGFLQSHHDCDDLALPRDPQFPANGNVVPRDGRLPAPQEAPDLRKHCAAA
jgi:hypothetical protein